jgi:hypothetical protein
MERQLKLLGCSQNMLSETQNGLLMNQVGKVAVLLQSSLHALCLFEGFVIRHSISNIKK